MRKGMKVFVLICCIFMVVGIITVGVGFALGGTGQINYGRYMGLGGFSGEIKNKEVRVSNFKNIDVDLSVSSVELVKGSEYKVECKYDTGIGEQDIYVENGTLHVKDKSGKSPIVNLGFNNITRDMKVKIYCPSEATLNNCKVDMDMGGAKIDGDFTGRVKVDCDLGEASLSGSFKGGIKANCDMGSVKIKTKDARTDYSMDLSVDLGDIMVDGENIKQSKFKEDSLSTSKISVDCNMGDISVVFGQKE